MSRNSPTEFDKEGELDNSLGNTRRSGKEYFILTTNYSQGKAYAQIRKVSQKCWLILQPKIMDFAQNLISSNFGESILLSASVEFVGVLIISWIS